MEDSHYITRRRGLLITTITALVSLVVGLTIGFLAERPDMAVPEPCAEALAAAEEIAAAAETEWATASAAVDAVQRAVDESNFRALAASCRDA